MKGTNSTNNQAQSDRAPIWFFWLWLAAALLVVIIIAVIGTAWAVRSAISGGSLISDGQYRVLMSIADFPSLVRTSVRDIKSRIAGEPLSLLLDRKATQKPNWVRRFPAPEDSGYLLFSGVDPALKRSAVQLIRLSDGATVARWDPDWSNIFEQHIIRGSPIDAQATHPLLLANGDIIFNINGLMLRLGPCSSRPVWALDKILMHHSIEFDVSGNAIWTPSISHDGLADNSWLRNKIRDDGLALVSTEGKLLENRSFARILRDNGLQAMLLATSGLQLNRDQIHMNQIQVARSDSLYWQRGDMLISARHLSTVFLYRPSTGKILWHQTGPWMNQHSVDFVDGHRISVFDNNVISGASVEHGFMDPKDSNRVLMYDFATKQISQPYAELLAEARPITFTAGRARVLPDGGLFVEETNYGRHLRFTRDRLLWSRVNDYDEERIGAVSWSRYLTADEVRAPLQALASRKCLVETSAGR